MEQDFCTHKLHYFALIIILIVGYGGFLFFSFDRQTQLLIGVIVSASYAVWGIVHHFAEHNLNWKIMVEYTLFSIISLAVTISLVLRK